MVLSGATPYYIPWEAATAPTLFPDVRMLIYKPCQPKPSKTVSLVTVTGYNSVMRGKISDKFVTQATDTIKHFSLSRLEA